MCQVEALVDSYEMTLFSASRRVPEEGGGVSHGSRGESALEVVMRSLAGFARSKSGNRDFIAAADRQFEALEEMKKEFPVSFLRSVSLFRMHGINRMGIYLHLCGTLECEINVLLTHLHTYTVHTLIMVYLIHVHVCMYTHV